MSIQSNINQMISIASVLATQNPAIQEKVKTREALKNLGQKEKILKQQLEVVSGKSVPKKDEFDTRPQADEFGAMVFTDIPDPEKAEKVSRGLADIAESKFEIAPSKETYEEALAAEYEIDYGTTPEQKERLSTFRESIRQQAAREEESARQALEQRQKEERLSRFLKQITTFD